MNFKANYDFYGNFITWQGVVVHVDVEASRSRKFEESGGVIFVGKHQPVLPQDHGGGLVLVVDDAVKFVVQLTQIKPNFGLVGLNVRDLGNTEKIRKKENLKRQVIHYESSIQHMEYTQLWEIMNI